MPPPTWLPTPSMIQHLRESDFAACGTGMSAGEMEKPKLNTPLASMLPPELSNIDVTSIFPEFRPGKVRHSNL